jgi:hypothetical protein
MQNLSMLSNKRPLVIELSVLFEKMISEILCNLLSIDMMDSKAFGNGRNSLSFASKLTILSDLRIIEKKDKIKFEYFSEIRNQFAHNLDAINYSTCFAFIDMENKLFKLYKNELKHFTDPEGKCEKLFGALFNDLSKIIDKLFTIVVKKSYKQGMDEARETLYDNLIETLKEYSEKDEELYNKMSKIFKVIKEKTTVQLKIKGQEGDS